MGWKATYRAVQTAERRLQRDSEKRRRELDKQLKEKAKLSAIERGRLEVEDYENRLEGLLSIHKERSDVIDWEEFSASLPPPAPRRRSYNEFKARQFLIVAPSNQDDTLAPSIEDARSKDDAIFQQESATYSDERAKWQRLKEMSRQVLAGDHKAYIAALLEFNPFAEMSDLGSSINFIIHSATLVECGLKVNGKQAIPDEFKSLTASGKLSVKPMAKGKFHELYQDYLSGCVLRVAREVLALLPVETVLVTASADFLNARTGHIMEYPVLSVVMDRSTVTRLNFDQLDPSEAIDNFQHRGDFKASRKLDTFNIIVPLTPADILNKSAEKMALNALVAVIQNLRSELKTNLLEKGSLKNQAVS